jgi:hypothetical protein
MSALETFAGSELPDLSVEDVSNFISLAHIPAELFLHLHLGLEPVSVSLAFFVSICPHMVDS